MSNSNVKCLFFFFSKRCIDCSLMQVLKSLGHKNLQLFLGMRSSNRHEIFIKWDIFNASVLLNEYGHPLFYFKIEVLN